jgi:spermidine synthase
VISATVVEIDPDVIALVGPTYTVDPRVEIVNADAFTYPPAHSRYGAVWHDIWDDFSDDEYEESKRLHRKYGGKADWQGSWGRDFYLAQRRRDRAYFWR